MNPIMINPFQVIYVEDIEQSTYPTETGFVKIKGSMTIHFTNLKKKTISFVKVYPDKSKTNNALDMEKTLIQKFEDTTKLFLSKTGGGCLEKCQK